MSKYRSYVLPAAILAGLFLHRWCAYLAWLSPFLIFLMLLLNFTAVDMRHLHLSRTSIRIMLYQAVTSIACYFIVSKLFHNELLAEGLLVGILCPVACSVVATACILGADRESVTEYTVWGNLMTALIAPFYFTFIGKHQDYTFWQSFLLIQQRLAPTIALPFFSALLLQSVWRKGNDFLCRFKDYSFHLWAVLLLISLGQTIDFIFLHGKGNELNILALGVASALTCIFHFSVGKLSGRKHGDSIGEGQLMGQKNTALGIWIATTYLNPLSSVFMAFYSVWQNLFNSWQIWHHDRMLSAHPCNPVKKP